MHGMLYLNWHINCFEIEGRDSWIERGGEIFFYLKLDFVTIDVFLMI